jgi:ABC-type Zn2+ transport system substrate-binding protein/surface adhesin
MDSEKLGDKSMIRILDPTHVNQASYTFTLNKNSKMDRNMSPHDFDIQVNEVTGIARSKVVLYIAKAMQAFVKDDKFLTKIPHFLSKFDVYSQFISSIEI